MPGSFTVGTIGGIAIRVHYTWIFAVLLIAWSLALGYFASSSQGRGAGTDWLLAIIASLLLFGSVLVHEIGHSLVARARGLRALPVVEAGQLVGIVSITDARDLPQDAWATTRVDEVMTRPPLETLAPEADLGRPWSGWSTAGSTSCPSCATGRWSVCSAAPTSCTTCSSVRPRRGARRSPPRRPLP
jgi:hypothetical protein